MAKLTGCRVLLVEDEPMIALDVAQALENEGALVVGPAIERYGADAVTQAAMQGSALLAKGDVEGLKAWLKVIAKIDHLQATKPAEGETVQ